MRLHKQHFLIVYLLIDHTAKRPAWYILLCTFAISTQCCSTCACHHYHHHHHHHHQFKVIYYFMLAWVRLFITIVFLQFSLFCARLWVMPSSRKSEAITCSQVFLGQPGSLLLLTSSAMHFFTQLLLSILTTWPNQRNQLRWTTLLTGSRSNLVSRSFEGILSLNVACDIQCSMDISVRCSLTRSSSFTGHVSLPYSSTCLTHAW